MKCIQEDIKTEVFTTLMSRHFLITIFHEMYSGLYIGRCFHDGDSRLSKVRRFHDVFSGQYKDRCFQDAGPTTRAHDCFSRNLRQDGVSARLFTTIFQDALPRECITIPSSGRHISRCFHERTTTTGFHDTFSRRVHHDALSRRVVIAS